MESAGSTIKKSSFQSLKQAKEHLSNQIKIRSKKMRKHKFLKEEIYKNHNIFQSLNNVNHFSKTMTAQNIIWTKNYELKQGINKLKEENSSLKARIWNVQKQNRKMDRQIEAWGLKKVFSNSSSKPYIDTATAQKVLHDQDYSITSIKILIVNLQHQLQVLSQGLQQSLILNKNIKNLKNDMKHQISNKKIELYNLSLWDELTGSYNKANLQQIRNEKREILIKKNKEIEFIHKNIILKQKSKLLLEEELTTITIEMENLNQISTQKIQTLKQQTYQLKTEDQSYVNEEVKKLSNVKEKYLQFECKLQDKMGQFIKKKISLTKEIKIYQYKISQINLPNVKVLVSSQRSKKVRSVKQMKQ